MKLIINADDFGMTKSVNKAVAELAQLGTLTSTTVMVNMPYWRQIIPVLCGMLTQSSETLATTTSLLLIWVSR